MHLKNVLPGIALLVLGAAAAPAQNLTVIPMGAASSGINQVTAEAIPNAPTNLQATAVSADQINVSWQDNSTDETQFRLEIRTTSGTYTDVGTAIPANVTGAQVHGLSPATTYFFRIKSRNASGDSPYSNEDSATTDNSATTCVPSTTAMCLNGNRFRVEAAFQTNTGLSGQAQVVKLTDDSGYLWFFNSANIELVIKVLDACAISTPRYWVFAGGLTNVRVDIVVTDTTTGLQARYTNPQNTAFQPIQDTNAFATCP